MQSLHVWFSHGIGDSKSSLYVCYESPYINGYRPSTLRDRLIKIINLSKNEECPLAPFVVDAIIIQDYMSTLEAGLWKLIKTLLKYVRSCRHLCFNHFD